MSEEDIADTVDEVADDIDPPRVQREADRLGINPQEFLRRVTNEVLARLGV